MKKPTKTHRVLRALLRQSYNRFEAARDLHDWCLHSTVATIQGKGIEVRRQFETVRGYEGQSTNVCRYWVAPDQYEKARKLLRLS